MTERGREENGNLTADKTKFLISLLNIPQESSFKTKEKLFSDTENLYGGGLKKPELANVEHV